MTTVLLHQVRCDAPRCPATYIEEEQPDSPATGWRRIHSTDHLDEQLYSGQIRLRRGHLGNGTSLSEAIMGSFTLHLCADHSDEFDAHLPRTLGSPPARSGTAHLVSVACSCGELHAQVGAVRVVGQKPASASAYAWFMHLPYDLVNAKLEAL